MPAELLDRLPIILPPLVAGLVIAGWLGRWLKRVWQLMGKANRFFDMVMGSPGHPSLMDEVAAVKHEMAATKQQFAEHLEWHGNPGGKPAAPDLTKPNGPRRTS